MTASRRSSAKSTLTADLAAWMTNLPDQLRRLPIIHLAIPGTHDSGTWPITKHSNWAPDLEVILTRLKCLGIILKSVVCRWSKAQEYNITQQLHAGVRYFDLRIATGDTKDNNREFYIVHGLYGASVKEVLDQLIQFLNSHPKEIVIIDCQHFYALSLEDHHRLATLFWETLETKLVQSASSYMQNLTMNYMNDNQYQVIMVYRHNKAREFNFYPSSAYPTPWPDTTSPDSLVEILTANLRGRNSLVGYVSQFILTPVAKTILGNLCTGNLKKFSGVQLQSKKLSWIKDQKPGPNGVNVIIGDFVNINDNLFCRTIIELNQKIVQKVETDTDIPRGLPPVTN